MVITPTMAIGGAAALGLGAYAISKISSNKAKGVSSALADSGKTITGMSADSVSNVVMDGATEEYNMARERYRMVAGAYPPRSWTIEMINMWIEEQSKKEDLIKQYVALVSANSSYVQRENTAELTYQQIQALIDSANETISAGKSRDAKIKEYDNLVAANSKYVTRESTSGLNAAQVQALIEKANAQIASKKKVEAEHRNHLSQLCDKFIHNATVYPGIGAATLSKYHWDEAMLMEIKALPAADKKTMNELLLEKTNGQGIKCCSYQAEAKSLWKFHKTIPEICALTINSGKTAASRNGAWACREVVEAYKADKVGADGSMVSASRPASTNPIIAFHLSQL